MNLYRWGLESAASLLTKQLEGRLLGSVSDLFRGHDRNPIIVEGANETVVGDESTRPNVKDEICKGTILDTSPTASSRACVPKKASPTRYVFTVAPEAMIRIKYG